MKFSFEDIRINGYHIETVSEGNNEYLYIVSSIESQKQILEKLSALSSGLNYTTISHVESHSVMNHIRLWTKQQSQARSLVILRLYGFGMIG